MSERGLLIGAHTYDKVQDLVETGEILNVRMKGIPGTVSLYDVHGIGAPFNLKLKERREALVALPEQMPVHLDRIRDKVVIATLAKAWLTHLSETGALTLFEGELAEWEDVRLHLLDADGQQLPGRIYGKVTALGPSTDGLHQATVRFTSVGPEIHQKIHELIGQA